MITDYYFAYGSNMHPLRFRQRVPSARFIATGTLSSHVLRFHKCGNDASGKCNAWYTGEAGDAVLGVIYTLSAQDKLVLDRVESLGSGYNLMIADIATKHGFSQQCFFYRADDAYIDDDLQPFDWYKQYVLQGALYHGLPVTYIDQISAVADVVDQNKQRLAQHWRHLSALSGKGE